MKRFYLLIFAFFIHLSFINNCTENPIFDDKIDVQENNLIKGKVNLGFDITPSNVYIWLERINISAWTDEEGNFQLKLPPSKTQPGDGVNGIYKLYVYAANYQFRQYDLLILNGEFEYNTSILDADGNFKETIILIKILDISTFIVPDNIQTTTKDTIDFTVRLESLVDSVKVRTHINQWGLPSSLVFLKTNSPIEEAVLIQGNPATFLQIIVKDVVLWPTRFVFSIGFFNEGIYQVIPYIQIVQEGMPEELLLSIDENIFDVNHHYLNWPIKQQPGLLTVEGLSD